MATSEIASDTLRHLRTRADDMRARPYAYTRDEVDLVDGAADTIEELLGRITTLEEGRDLALWLTPKALREAYDDAPEEFNPTIAMSDEALVEIGQGILDGVYNEYRRLLSEALGMAS